MFNWIFSLIRQRSRQAVIGGVYDALQDLGVEDDPEDSVAMLTAVRERLALAPPEDESVEPKSRRKAKR